MSNKLILVLNCGSSSLKFAIIDCATGDEKLSGLAECLHLENASIKWKLEGIKGKAELGNSAAHKEALSFIVNDILGDKAELKDNLHA
ncbi:MAG: acetate kinase, partial [Alteromonadales bacterium]|nr:acetate kinase [Alteromonadales bacterium]